MNSWPRSCTLKLLLLLGLAVLAAVLSLCIGPVNVSLFAQDSLSQYIIGYVRLPRTCACLLAGSALAVSGAVIQGVLGNPLAAPNIIGVSSGAGLGAAVCGALAPAMAAAVPAAAFAGALAAVLLVLFIGERTGASRLTLVLAGVAVSGMFGACTDAVVALVPDALAGWSDFRTGGLANLSMARIAPALDRKSVV